MQQYNADDDVLNEDWILRKNVTQVIPEEWSIVFLRQL
jgi:hypothetical protein